MSNCRWLQRGLLIVSWVGILASSACLGEGDETGPEMGRSARAVTTVNGIQLNRVSPNGIQLNGIQLNSIQHNGIQLNGIQLNGADLNGIQLNGIQLNSIRLNSIRLNGIDLNGIQRNGIQLNGIQLNSIQLNGIQLNGIQLNGIQLNGIQLNRLRLNGIQLNGIQLNGIQLNGIQLNGIRLNGIQLDGIQLNGIRLDGIQLNGIQLAEFQQLLSYMVACGLSANQCVDITDQDGSTYSLCGQDGLAPSWATQMLQSQDEEAAVTQCVIDRATAAGDSVSHTNIEAEALERSLSHVITCALPSNRCVNITRLDGSTQRYCGWYGLDPGWETGSADPAASEAVTACVLDRAEAAGDPALDYQESFETVLIYAAQCALPEGQSVTMTGLDGAPMTIAGSLGLAPWWADAPLNPAPSPLAADVGEKRVSACLAARSNALGKAVRVSLRGSALTTTPLERGIFQDREGTFWGSLFSDTPYVNTCAADGSGVIGRQCTGGGDCGFTFQGACASVCGTEDGVEGYYADCNSELETITTFLDLPKTFAVTVTHGCAADASGAVHCWGSNDYAELGDGNERHASLRPQRVAGLPAAASYLSAARKNTTVRLADGSLYCWGRDDQGQCGDGSKGINYAPQATLVPDRVSWVSADEDHRCAMLTDGQMYCFGRNNSGQIGIGNDNDDEPYPRLPIGMNDVVHITTGGKHTCAVTSSGSAYCWGNNDHAELGRGWTSNEQLSPGVVLRNGQPLQNVTDICGGGSFTCARDVDANVYCWGLGYGTSAALVTGIGSAPAAGALECGMYHACTLGADGQAWCWGTNNVSGQLGRGTVDAVCASGCNTPQPVSGLSDVVEIDAAGRSTCARTGDGLLWCWGENDWGQLGDRTRTQRPAPVQNLNFTEVTGCGDGMCTPWEQASCAADCAAGGVCGDRVVDPDEDCDDGAASVTCDADCTAASCGDGTCNVEAETYTSCNADCAPPQQIVISAWSDRRHAGPLDGRLLYGPDDARIFISPDAGVSKVVFRLDGATYRTDTSAPFDFAGGTSSSATTWSSTTVADGTHTIEADITTPSGTYTARATFTVDNTTPVDYQLLVTTDPDRSGGIPLESQTLAGDVYIFVWPESMLTKVEFDLDGSSVQTENNGPWDFEGGTADTPDPWNTTGTSDGTHRIDAVLHLAAGGTRTISDTFTINNGGGAPFCGDGTCGVGEDCGSCSADCGACGPFCGDGTCNAGEDCSSCSADCGACGSVCGDGTCDAGEDCSSCSADCGACGPVCGDAVCDAGEDCGSCSADCGTCGSVCGDAVCDAGEDCSSCTADCGACGPVCGDAVCDAGEDCGECAADCGACPPATAAHGWVWASSPSSTSYTPSLSYQYNSASGTNTITRSGVGVYEVRFPNLGGAGGTVHVTAYGSSDSAYCNSAGWYASGADLFATVRCYAAGGAPTDTNFTALYARETNGGASGTTAYLWANEMSSADYAPAPSYSYNDTGAVNRVRRSGAGNYTAELPGMIDHNASVLVTAYGSGAERCKVGGWWRVGDAAFVDVSCTDAAGTPRDSLFTLSYTVRGVLGLGTGGADNAGAYAWANNATSANYTPDTMYQHNDLSAGALRVLRTSTGAYRVEIPHDASISRDIVLVTAYGGGAERCKVGGWSRGSTLASVYVYCFDAGGAYRDTLFNVAYMTSNNSVGAPFCGDGTCGAGEDCGSCSADCGTCTTVPVTVNPYKDAYVRDGSYSNSNYGTSTTVQIKGGASSGYNRRGYLAFDIAAFSGTVGTATLKLYKSAGGNVSVTVSRLHDDTWGESSITWNNKPAPGSAIRVHTLVDGWNNIDVTPWVNEEVSAGSTLIGIHLQTGNGGVQEEFHSREGTNKPVLEVAP